MSSGQLMQNAKNIIPLSGFFPTTHIKGCFFFPVVFFLMGLFPGGVFSSGVFSVHQCIHRREE